MPPKRRRLAARPPANATGAEIAATEARCRARIGAGAITVYDLEGRGVPLQPGAEHVLHRGRHGS